MDEILRLRFQDRDNEFVSKLVAVQQNMAARGLLGSGEAIKQGHAVLVEEYIGSRIAIVGAVSEKLRIDRQIKIDPKIFTEAQDLLRKRKEFLEAFYAEKMKVIISSLKNEKMHSQYTTLNEFAELHAKELERSLSQEIAAYLDSRGATLMDRVKNQFLDRPLVVIAVITASAVTAVLAFLNLVGIIR